MLTFAEELLLLALDDEKGVLVQMPIMSFEYGLVGAILMELALMNKIDTDLKNLKPEMRFSIKLSALLKNIQNQKMQNIGLM